MLNPGELDTSLARHIAAVDLLKKRRTEVAGLLLLASVWRVDAGFRRSAESILAAFLAEEGHGQRGIETARRLLADLLVPDALWSLVEPLLPTLAPRPQGGGARCADQRAQFTAIVYVLTNCVGFRGVPPGLGADFKTVWRWWAIWTRAGVWDRLLESAIQQHDERAEAVARAALVRVAGTRHGRHGTKPARGGTDA